jgi:hypothetical protein
MTRARGGSTSVESFRLAPAPPVLSPAVAVAAALGTAVGSLGKSIAFRQLPLAQQAAIERDLRTIRHGLATAAAAPDGGYASALETPDDLLRRRAAARYGGTEPGGATAGNGTGGVAAPGTAASKARPATETLAARVGALSDEVDFPAFVAGLVHGTFDAMLDASIRQMEAFADLVGAVAKTVDEFTRDNVSRGQAIDILADKYPRDLVRIPASAANGGLAQLQPRTADDGSELPSPEWLAEYDLAGESLTDDVIEEQLIPAARRRTGESRLQTLATMVLLGMNRVVVKDGTIAAKVRFRAAARDTALVNYAVSQDPAQQGWGERGSAVYAAPSTMISTVNANVQTETSLNAELFGEVRINFVSETLPLDRFVDAARMSLLQGNARVAAPALPAPAATPALPAPPAAAAPVVPPPAATPTGGTR